MALFYALLTACFIRVGWVCAGDQQIIAIGYAKLTKGMMAPVIGSALKATKTGSLELMA